MSRPPLTLLDRALGYLAPQVAYRRYASRMALHLLSGRGYDVVGAASQRVAGMSGLSNASADVEIAAAAPVLRARMRDLVRNNPLAAQAVQVLVNNMVGTGIRPRAATGDASLDARVNALWEDWSRECDADGHTDFHGLVSLAVRGMIEGGETLAVRRAPGRQRGRVPLKVALYEPDFIDDGRMSVSQRGARVDRGIEYSEAGERLAYWMFPEHPGGRAHAGWRSMGSVRVPADDVAHLFERQRLQNRGVPWGVPAMRSIEELGNWQIAELTRKRTEACLVGVVTSDEANVSLAPGAADGQLVDGRGVQVEQFSPGMIAYLRGGTGVEFLQPSSAGGVDEWNRVQMHIIAAGFRVPYALMTGDMSQANFSSTRAGLNEFRRMVESVQWLTIIPMLCQRIWDWFVEEAHREGLLPQDRIAVEWGPPRFESVNPLQDAQTDLLEVRAGFASLPQMVAKRGYDAAEVLRETGAALKEAQALGLVLDSDGSQTSRAGQMQAHRPAPGDGNGDS